MFRICMVGCHATDPERYPSPGQCLADRFRRDGHSVLLTSQRRSRVGRLAGMTVSLVRRRREYAVACVDTFSTSALWYARLSAWIAKRLGKKVIVVLHGGRLPELARARPGRLRGLLQRADRVIAPSRFLARELGATLSVPVEVIGNPIETGLYPTRVRAAPQPRLLWLRAFRDMYRPDVAVRAVALLAGRFPGVRLVMAGPERDGSLAEVRALAGKLGVSRRVTFPGLVTKAEVRRLGHEADVFLNTSATDNTPVSVIEAMAMGLCIVSTEAGGLADLLRRARDALLVRTGDAPAMAAAIARILTEPGLAAALSCSAAERALDFDLERVAEQWYGLLEEVS